MAFLVLAFPAGGVAATASCAAREVPADAFAVVDSTPLPLADLDALLARSPVAPSRATREFAVRALVEGRVLRVKASELGIAVAPERVDARLATFIRQYFGGDRRRYDEQLAKQGMSDAQVRSDIEALLLRDALFARVTKTIRVTERDVRTYYAHHREGYRSFASARSSIRSVLLRQERETAYARWWSGMLRDFACRIAYAPGYGPA